MIKIELKDGAIIEVEKGSSIIDVAKKISEGLARVTLAGLVNGEVQDLRHKLTEDCKLEILTFDSLEGKKAYWHTTSHIMAQAIKRLYPEIKLAIGPSIDNGFYYDFDTEKPFSEEDLIKIEDEMKKIIKDILILCVITIICGGLLGYVYQITKNPIQHQLQQSKQYAYLKVMKEATSFKTYKENDIKKLSKKLKGDYGKNGLEIENALKAYHQKQTIGYIIQVTDHDGFGGDIEIIVGINLQKEISGVEILSIDETVGLGMNAKNEDFRNQYVGKKVKKFQVVKNGKQNEDEVDSLSGATITSKAMTNGINGALDFYDLLKGR